MRLFAAIATAGLVAPLTAARLASQDSLHVLYHTSGDTVAPSSIVTVMFDRPVAGALDSTVSAARVFHIEPNVAGSVARRDPVTIRFIPASALTPGTRYVVTIDDAIRAADGSTLGASYRFSFRVAGPRLLARSFDRQYFGGGETLAPDGRIMLLYSGPVDVERLQRAARIELSGCTSGDTIPYRVVRQRPIGVGDPDSFRWVDGYPDSIGMSLRRVVELEPLRTLPLECGGKIVIPTTVDDSTFGRLERFVVRTAPVFRIRALDCRTEDPFSPPTCNKGVLTLWLSSPIRRSDLLRYARINGQSVVYEGRAEVSKQWSIPVRFVPRTSYTILLDPALRDVYGRRLEGPNEISVVTADFAPQVAHATGIITAPASGPRTFPLRSVNVESVRIIAYRVPDSSRTESLMRAPGLADLRYQMLRRVRSETTVVSLPDRLNRDTTVELPIPSMALAADHPLVAVEVEVARRLPAAYSPDSSRRRHELVLQWPDRRQVWWSPMMLLQVTNLAVTAKLVGVASGAAVVTDLATGQPRPNATVSQVDLYGRAVGRGVTNAEGIAVLERIAPDSVLPPRTPATPTPDYSHYSLLAAEAGADRVAVPLDGRFSSYQDENPLGLAALGVRRDTRPLVAADIFAERDIFRPGEVVHLKGVVRHGMLGALHLPPRADSVRIKIHKRPEWWLDDGVTPVRDTVVRLSEFGTVVDSVRLRPGSVLGGYVADLSVVVRGQWTQVASTGFKLAEYRAPQFLVDLVADSVTRYGEDTVHAVVHGRYLFDAPMRRGVVKWTAAWDPADAGRLNIPHTDGWDIGGWSGWGGVPGDTSDDRFDGVDTLDAEGRAHIRIPVIRLPKAPGELEIGVAVTDLDGQVITTSATSLASPSSIYVLARDTAKRAWRVGVPATIDVRAVDRFGMPVRDAVVRVLVLRRHARPADPTTGAFERWVVDTVRLEELRPAGDTVAFSFTPTALGEYLVDLSARDAAGAVSHTLVERSVVVAAVAATPSPGYRLALRADTTKLSVGQTARLHFDSPFEDAEAWITVEREGIIDQRRQHARRGENVAAVPITERYAPNVFVSVLLLARADSTAVPDTATDRLRAGYVELTVATDRQRLSVALATDRASYAPRDTVTVRVHVRDADGRGLRSEVALWAVDQGVLALTGFSTPNVLSGVYAPRGVGAPLWSTWPTVLTTNPELTSTFGHPYMALMAMTVGNSMITATPGVVQSSLLRSHFNSTAFYLGSIVTDKGGNAVARAAVPDNLTTFRIMAAAVTAGDRYGSGETTMVVTRPLVARAALPRFVRPSDSLVAGVVVTPRDGRPRAATTDVSTTGLTIHGPARMSISLTGGGSAKAQFVITTPGRNAVGDSVAVRLGATDGATADGTETWLPVRPDFHPRTHAILGAVRDSQDVSLVLPADIDPQRSRLRLRIGTSRLSTMLAGYRWLLAYRFDCTEQLTSVGRGIIAVWRATRRERQDVLGGDPHAKLQEIADEISLRQDPDGSIQYWRGWHWSSPWLTAYAGLFLLDARDLGVAVNPGVITRASKYLHGVLLTPFDTGGMNRYQQRARRLALGDRIAATEYLRRAGEPDTATERALLRVARVMTWEDRLRFAEVIASRSDMRPDAGSIVDSAWRAVTVAGHRVDLPDSAHAVRAFPSRIAPAARLLSASLVLRPTHPLLAALTETVLQTGRAESIFALNTQDYASVLMALANMEETKRDERVVTARAGQSRFVAHPPAAGVDTTIAAPLVGMLATTGNGDRVLHLHVDATAGDRPVYYALEVDEVPLAAPVKPDVKGIVVERWYERFDDGSPVTRVNEGDLVRVRLRVTVPADREFVAVEDPLPAGLEPVDPSLRTSATLEPFTTPESVRAEREGNRGRDGPIWQAFLYGSWDGGHWSPWEHKELHDDRVTYFARMLWTGSYTASYVARATTAGSFVAPPAYAEEMYNPALQGRSSGGRFAVDRLR